MQAGSESTRRPKLLSAIALGLGILLVSANPSVALNASDKEANHLNRDKWAKTAPSFKSGSSQNDDEDDSKSSHSSHASSHEGELNGHLHVHNW